MTFTGQVIGNRKALYTGAVALAFESTFESEIQIILDPEARYPTSRYFSVPGQLPLGSKVMVTIEVEQ